MRIGQSPNRSERRRKKLAMAGDAVRLTWYKRVKDRLDLFGIHNGSEDVRDQGSARLKQSKSGECDRCTQTEVFGSALSRRKALRADRSATRHGGPDR